MTEAEVTVDSGTEIPGETRPNESDPVVAEALETERRARLYGWKDKTEFDRPPERWKPAKEFLETQETNLPVLKENLHRLEGKFGQTEQSLREVTDRLAGMTAAFEHMQGLAMTAEQRAFERAKKEFEREKTDLERTIDQAAGQADVTTVRNARQALAQLREPTPPAAPERRPAPARVETAPAQDPAETAAITAFTASEKWFRTRLSEVREAVSQTFPRLFAAPGGNDPVRVAAPSTTGPGRSTTLSGRGWNDIPAEDRSAAKKIIDDVNRGRKDGKKFTEAEYASTYWKGQN